MSTLAVAAGDSGFLRRPGSLKCCRQSRPQVRSTAFGGIYWFTYPRILCCFRANALACCGEVPQPFLVDVVNGAWGYGCAARDGCLRARGQLEQRTPASSRCAPRARVRSWRRSEEGARGPRARSEEFKRMRVVPKCRSAPERGDARRHGEARRRTHSVLLIPPWAPGPAPARRAARGRGSSVRPPGLRWPPEAWHGDAARNNGAFGTGAAGSGSPWARRLWYFSVFGALRGRAWSARSNDAPRNRSRLTKRGLPRNLAY